MHTHPPHHRLVLAAPIFALCVAGSIVGGVLQMRQSPTAFLLDGIVEAAGEARVVEVAGGRLRLQPGAAAEIAADRIVLQTGDALVLADAALAMEVNGVTLSGLAGGWFVSAGEAGASIAALTTPVRMQQGGEERVIPVRMQRTTASGAVLQAVPRHFLRAQLPHVLALPRPAAAVREDDWLLRSLHPQVRSAVWSLPVPEDIDPAERAERLILLPLSDRLPEPLPERIVSWWAEDLAAEAARDTEGAFLLIALPRITQSIAQLHRDGYPGRARTYASRLQGLQRTGVFGASATVRSALDTLEPVLAPAPVPLVTDPAPVADPVPPAPETSVDPSALRAAATDALRAAGFMFTGRTQILPEGPVATVTDIVLGTPGGDRLLQFSFDPLTGTVSRIAWEGEVLPYSLGLEKFVEWVKMNG